MGQHACIRIRPARLWLRQQNKRMFRTLVNIISSTPRVFLSGCGQARFAGNSVCYCQEMQRRCGRSRTAECRECLTRVLITHRGAHARQGLSGEISISLLAATEHSSTVPSARTGPSPTPLAEGVRSGTTLPRNKRARQIAQRPCKQPLVMRTPASAAALTTERPLCAVNSTRAPSAAVITTRCTGPVSVIMAGLR